MTDFSDLLLLLVVLTDFWVLGTTRLSSVIRAAALQGAILGALPVALHPGLSPHLLGLGIGTLVVKAIVLPAFLHRAIREASVRREVEPVIGFTASLCAGATCSSWESWCSTSTASSIRSVPPG
jgi:hydrogenase-4 component E